MKIVLLGPNGQLGTDIRSRFERKDRGAEVTGIARNRLDVTDGGTLRSLLRDMTFDVLINCTGYHNTDQVEGDATKGFAVNSHAVQQMASICAAKGARFIHISTDYVFGGDIARTEPLVETDPPAPVNIYGSSKAMGERLAMLACDKVTVLRVASLFGLAGARGKVILLMDNGGSLRDLYRERRPSLEGRPIFTNSQPGDADGAFVKVNTPQSNEDYIRSLVADGYVVRTRSDTPTVEARSADTARLEAALASGAQWVSTDYPVPGRSEFSDYVAQIPGGEPARCNPVNTGPRCRDSLLERQP